MKFEEDKELSHIEKQTILYFKGHFKVTDMVSDLKVFTAAQYDFGVEHCEFRHVYGYIKKLYFRLKKMNYIKTDMEDFLSDMFKWRDGSITPVGVIEQMRSEIANMVVQGVMELGDPDFSLLPKKEEYIEIKHNKFDHDNIIIESPNVHYKLKNLIMIED